MQKGDNTEQNESNKTKPQTSTPDTSNSNQTAIENAAVEALLRETKRAADRAETGGASGWLPPRCGKPNKRFIKNQLNSVIFDRKIRDGQISKKSVDKKNSASSSEKK